MISELRLGRSQCNILFLNVAVGGVIPNGIYGSRTPIPQMVPGAALSANWVSGYDSIEGTVNCGKRLI
jgi:hypothetical protein